MNLILTTPYINIIDFDRLIAWVFFIRFYILNFLKFNHSLCISREFHLFSLCIATEFFNNITCQVVFRFFLKLTLREIKMASDSHAMAHVHQLKTYTFHKSFFSCLTTFQRTVILPGL